MRDLEMLHTAVVENCIKASKLISLFVGLIAFIPQRRNSSQWALTKWTNIVSLNL